MKMNKEQKECLSDTQLEELEKVHNTKFRKLKKSRKEFHRKKEIFHLEDNDNEAKLIALKVRGINDGKYTLVHYKTPDDFIRAVNLSCPARCIVDWIVPHSEGGNSLRTLEQITVRTKVCILTSYPGVDRLIPPDLRERLSIRIQAKFADAEFLYAWLEGHVH